MIELRRSYEKLLRLVAFSYSSIITAMQTFQLIAHSMFGHGLMTNLSSSFYALTRRPSTALKSEFTAPFPMQ